MADRRPWYARWSSPPPGDEGVLSRVVARGLREALTPVTDAFLDWLPSAPAPTRSRFTQTPPRPTMGGERARLTRLHLTRAASAVFGTRIFPRTEAYVSVANTLPIGHYGKAYAVELQRTASDLREHWLTFREGPGREQVDAVIAEHRRTLERGTFWAGHYRRIRNQSLEDPVNPVMLDGIQSTIQAIAHLTAHPVAGYDDPIALADAVVRSQLPERLALWMPLNLVGPMTLAGEFFTAPIIEPDEKRGLRFTANFSADLRAEKHAQRRMVDRFGFRLLRGRGAEALGCPVARVSRGGEKASVITRLGEACVADLVRAQLAPKVEPGRAATTTTATRGVELS